MEQLQCSGKINVSLRITGKLPSGYHELCSIFLRINAIESLTIDHGLEDNVRVHFKCTHDVIQGRNILLKTLDAVRQKGQDVPALDMSLEKRVPPGTGLGCGSGDAAALLLWLSRRGYDVKDCAELIGADVPFFCQESAAALASGIGEKIEPLDADGLDLRGVIVIPDWRCLTAPGFRALDEYYKGVWPANQAEARAESLNVLESLRKGEKYGRLPNDFCAPLMEEHGEYGELFLDFESLNALAWGISGSGSSAFGLWKDDSFPTCRLEKTWRPWMEDILIFQIQDKENK